MEQIMIDIRNEREYLKRQFEGKDYITMEELLETIENIILDNERLEEELKDLQQDLEDNYKPISQNEQIGEW